MKLLDGTHCYIIVGDKSYLKLIRSATALTQACDLVARLRIRHTDQRYKIMEPRFCEHGCCILEERIVYIIGAKATELLRNDYEKCALVKRGRSLV